MEVPLPPEITSRNLLAFTKSAALQDIEMSLSVLIEACTNCLESLLKHSAPCVCVCVPLSVLVLIPLGCYLVKPVVGEALRGITSQFAPGTGYTFPPQEPREH